MSIDCPTIKHSSQNTKLWHEDHKWCAKGTENKAWLVVKPTSQDRNACRNAPCMFGWPPYVWTPPVCLHVPICLDAPCMFGNLHKFGCPMFGHPPYVWMPPVCLDALQMSGHAPCLDTPICLDAPYVWCTPCLNTATYVWVPPVGLDIPLVWQSMLSLCCVCTGGIQTYGGIHVPCMFGCLPYVWMPTCMFGCPLYVWTTPICLASPYMFGCPHMFGHLHMFGCPCMLGHPHIWTPNMFGWPHVWIPQYDWRSPIYVWMPPICLDAPCLDTINMFGHPHVCLDDKACFLCVVCSIACNTLLLWYLVLYIVLNPLQLNLWSKIKYYDTWMTHITHV